MGKGKISIVGANSFLAVNLIEELLKKGYSLNLYARKQRFESDQITFFQFDYPEIELNFAEIANSEAIVFAAGAGIQAGRIESTDQIYQINANLPISLLLYLEEIKYKGKIVTFGSYFEIGKYAECRPYNEDELIGLGTPVPNHYCSSKRLLSRFVANGVLTIKHLHLILPTIYGPGENQNRLIPYVVKNIQEENILTLTSGQQSRSYLYVKDFVHFVEEALQLDHLNGIFNVPAGDQIKIKDLVILISSVLNKPFNSAPAENLRADVSMQHLELDCSKLTGLTSWEPKNILRDIIPLY